MFSAPTDGTIDDSVLTIDATRLIENVYTFVVPSCAVTVAVIVAVDDTVGNATVDANPYALFANAGLHTTVAGDVVSVGGPYSDTELTPTANWMVNDVDEDVNVDTATPFCVKEASVASER